MIPLLAFAVTLLLAVLLSSLAQRSVLSTAVLFLVAGFVLGEGVLGVLHFDPEDPVVAGFTELALFSVLCSAPACPAGSGWRRPGSAPRGSPPSSSPC